MTNSKSGKKIVELQNVTKEFEVKGDKFFSKEKLVAVDNISFDIYEGETFGLIGESGSGKSTLGKTILKLHTITSGKIILNDSDINDFTEKEFRKMRKDYQIIFQNSSFALDPKMFVKDIIAEPMLIHSIVAKKDIDSEVGKLLEKVGLPIMSKDKFPSEFSGGERQRLVIAKVLATRPKFIVCDEPVSALDISVQAKIINLLMDLKKEFGLTYLFIAHGLNVVKYIADKVGVMYLGQIVEIGTCDEIFSNPKHPYTKSLISSYTGAIPTDQTERIILKGEIPSALKKPSGCIFHTRCPWMMEECKVNIPQAKTINESHTYSCIL